MKEEDLKLIIKALSFAAHKHKDQRRKDVAASPYINHPISLASILCNEAHVTDVDVICGALLHDTVEDTDTSFEEIEIEFGSNISKIVQDVTDDKSLEKSERKRMQVEHAAHACTNAKLVKLADKISNLRDVSINPPKGWEVSRCQEYFDWAKNVIDQVRGTNIILEKQFDDIYASRPNSY